MNASLIIVAIVVLGMSLPGRITAQHHGAEPHQEQGGDPHGGDANAHMRQSSVVDLIERFESPDRDAYQQPEKVLDFLDDIRGKTVVDIGAGSGYFSVKLAARGARVIAADVSDEFQAYLRERIERDGLSNIELRKIPYDSPGLADGEADLVFLVNTYHHIADRVDYFGKVREGMAADGELVIIDFYKIELPVGPPPGHKLSMDEVVMELKAAGFTAFEVDVNLLPYQFIIRAR